MSEKSSPKKFYTEVSLKQDDSGLTCIALDGRIAKTPGRHNLGTDKQSLAEAVAAEWSAQTDTIELQTMPLTRLLGAVIDAGDAARAGCAETILNYASSDLLCYRAPDAALAERQAAVWQPILDRVSAHFGAAFAVTTGIAAIEQPTPLLDAMKAHLVGLDTPVLFTVSLLTELTGSAALAFAVLIDEAPSEDVFAASHLDETYQEERWGQDAEAMERRRTMKAEFDAIVRFLRLSQGEAAA